MNKLYLYVIGFLTFLAGVFYFFNADMAKSPSYFSSGCMYTTEQLGCDRGTGVKYSSAITSKNGKINQRVGNQLCCNSPANADKAVNTMEKQFNASQLSNLNKALGYNTSQNVIITPPKNKPAHAVVGGLFGEGGRIITPPKNKPAHSAMGWVF